MAKRLRQKRPRVPGSYGTMPGVHGNPPKRLRQKMPRQPDGGAGAGVHGAVLHQRRPQLHLGNSQHGRGINGEARMNTRLKFPAPFFGGKSRIAPLIWERLGDCDNVIEPFCGSAAFLLARPHPPRVETLNDIDCYVANVWRSLKRDPEAVAEYADDPVNEADLHSRHRWLVGIDPPEHSWWTNTPYLHALAGASSVRLGREQFRKRVRTDPEYFDARVAGWWLWGSCCWIGGGWCSVGGSHGPAGGSGERRPKIDEGVYHGNGVHAQGTPAPDQTHAEEPRRPYLGTGGPEGNSPCPGRGVHGAGPALSEQLPLIGGCGEGGVQYGLGVHAKGPDGHRPQLADARSRGRGVHNDNHLSQQVPLLRGSKDGHPTGTGCGVIGQSGGGTCAQRRAWLLDWFGRLRDRLRTVRVCCGNWLRVCDSESVTTRLGTTGVFLDPPYPTHHGDGEESRSGGLYATDGTASELDHLRDEVLAWCRERGPDPRLRIVVAGYDTDGYAALVAEGWEEIKWRAQGGYGNRSKKGKANAGRERLWCSPGCAERVKQPCPLFDYQEED